MDIAIELGKILLDNDEAREVIKQVQAALTELSEANLEAIDAAKGANKVCDEYQSHVRVLTKANVDLTEALKSVHIVLGSKKDLWENDAEIKTVMNSLATFVMGSGAIKSGVIAQGMNDERY